LPPFGAAYFSLAIAIRAKLPSGYKVPPHTHPTAENVTVLSGAFHIGMGST